MSAVPDETVKYPAVSVDLSSGHDGNAFFILATVRRSLRAGGVPSVEIEKFEKEATSGDYDHVLRTVMRWVTVE